MRSRLGVGVVAMMMSAGATVALGAPGALDKPAFTATAAELLALAAAAPPRDGASIVVLREQRDVSVDDRGRATTHDRWVFVIRTQAGVDDSGTISTAWSPFHQDKPVIRARVIDPAGTVASLDPSLVTDTPEAQVSSSVFSDRRYVRAPLPRLVVGAVVEQEIVKADREPILAVGGVTLHGLGNDAPTESTVFTFSAPAARKVHHVERELPAQAHATHQIAGGRELWSYQVTALPVAQPLEPGAPSDSVAQPYVGFGMAPSWSAVAAEYHKLVDQRIAEGPFALPAELPRTPSLETVNAITAWLHRQVRYTGIELGASALIPFPPAQTAGRGFGDCKDKATLLVAMLRQAGIRAELALLATGPGPDIDPDLPGMGVFDHAIVRARVGARELWIDATQDLARPGQLPPSDQGRRALVIAPDTRGLVTTPVAAAADNRIYEIRTFVAAEAGAAELTEVSREGGVYEAIQRSWIRDTPAVDVTKRLTEYAEHEYEGTLASRTTTPAADLATAFEMTLAVKAPVQVYTHREQIDVELHPRATLNRLPPTVADKPKVPRTRDYVWPAAHVYEVENRIVVPPGFTLPAPEPERTRAIGTASFTERQRVDGQTLIVSFRFDSGKPRLSPAELTALQAAVHQLRDEVVRIKISHTGLMLSHEDRPGEAVAEIDRLIALHPREALHHTQRSTVLLRAGAGEAARREARKAVELAPADADALTVLGWTLQFDTLGRRFVHDWDRAGAIAALQKARTLDPKHAGAAVELVDVASRDATGRPYERGADLRLALEAARAAYALDGSDDNALAIVKLLTWLGEAREAETIARGMTSRDRDGWLVTATAMARGAPEAIQTAGQLRLGSERSPLIDTAAGMLFELRQYDLSRALFRETGTLAHQGGAQATLMAAIRRHDEPKAGKDLQAVAFATMVECTNPDGHSPLFWNTDVERRIRDDAANERKTSGKTLFTEPVLGDILQTTLHASVDGDRDAWRVSFTGAETPVAMYLALDHGVIKVLGDPSAVTALGGYALDLLDRKRDDVARRLMEWLVRDLAGSPAGKRVGQFVRAGVPTDHAHLALAAAALAYEAQPDRAIAVLSRCKTTFHDVERACHNVLLTAYGTSRRWEAFERELAIVRQQPEADTSWALALHVTALTRLHRFDEAERALDEALAADSGNHDALVAKASLALERGDRAAARKRADALAGRAGASPEDVALAAWLQISAGAADDAALDRARRAVQAGSTHATLSALAALEAERGELGVAVDDEWKALAEATSSSPDDADRYVFGRIYEQLGLRDDAIAVYRKIRPGDGSPTALDLLAAKRLAALRARP